MKDIIDRFTTEALGKPRHVIYAVVGAGAREVQKQIAIARGSDVIASGALKDWWRRETNLRVETPDFVKRHPEYSPASVVIDEIRPQQQSSVTRLVRQATEVSIRHIKPYLDDSDLALMDIKELP